MKLFRNKPRRTNIGPHAKIDIIHNPKHTSLFFCAIGSVPFLLAVIEYLVLPQRSLAGLFQFAFLPATGLLAYFLCFHVLRYEHLRHYFFTGLVISIINMLSLFISMQFTGCKLEEIPLIFADLILCLGAFFNGCGIWLMFKLAKMFPPAQRK